MTEKTISLMERKSTLMPKRFKVKEFMRTTFVAVAEQGTTQEDLLRPDFWSNIAAQVKPWDEIEVLSDDGTFYGEYLVLSCSKTWVKVKEMRYEDLTQGAKKTNGVGVAEESQSEFSVKWRGPVLKWCVIRILDKQPIKDGFVSEADARTALDEYLKAVA